MHFSLMASVQKNHSGLPLWSNHSHLCLWVWPLCWLPYSRKFGGR